MKKGIGKGGIPMDERVNIAEALWVTGFKKWQILKELQERFGVGRDLAQKDLARARARLGDEAQGTTRIEKRNRVGDALLEIVRSADFRDRLRALDQYAKLYALDEHPDMGETTQDIEVVSSNWRGEFKDRLDNNLLRTAKGNGIPFEIKGGKNGDGDQG